MPDKGINLYFSKPVPIMLVSKIMRTIGSQYANCQNFENIQFPFAGSHKLGITY